MATALTPIAWQSLSSATASVTFSSIPSSYRDLRLVMQFGYSGSGGTPIVQLNGDTAYNYNYVVMEGNGASTFSSTGNQPGMTLTFRTPPTSATAIVTLDILDYSATDKHKTGLSRYNDAAAWVNATSNRWSSTSAVNSLTITFVSASTFPTGSTFALYGIAG